MIIYITIKLNGFIIQNLVAAKLADDEPFAKAVGEVKELVADDLKVNSDALEHEIHIRNDGQYYKVLDISDREKCLSVWNKYDLTKKHTLAGKYYPNRIVRTLTGREIQNIIEGEQHV